MFDMALNMPLDYLSCFARVIRGILRDCLIYAKLIFSIHFKLRTFPHSEIVHGSTTLKQAKRLKKVKEI